MPSQWCKAALPTPHFQFCFCRKVLIQNPAHANNFIHMWYHTMKSYMMSYVISYTMCRHRAQKPSLAFITAGLNTISLARRGLIFICWNLLVLKWFKSSCKTTCATPILQTRHGGSSASIVLHIPLFACFHQSLLHGLEITMVRSLAYLPCAARNGLQVNWTPSCCTIWSHPREVLVSFETLVALSGRVSSTAADQRHVAIPSISLAIASGERPVRSAAVWYHIWYHIWHHIWYNNILYVTSCVISYICSVTWALIWYHMISYYIIMISYMTSYVI